MKNEYKCQIEFYNDNGFTYSRPVYLQIMKCFKKENYIRIYILTDDKIKFSFSTDDDVYIKLHILDNNETFPIDKRDFRLNKLYNQFHSIIGRKSDLKKNGYIIKVMIKFIGKLKVCLLKKIMNIQNKYINY